MFKKYHFAENVKIISAKIPGLRSKFLLKKQKCLEGSNIFYSKHVPIAFDKAKGAIVVV